MGNCLGKVASRVLRCVRGRFGGVDEDADEAQAPPANNDRNSVGSAPQPRNSDLLHTTGYPGRGVIDSFPTLRQRRHPAVEEHVRRGGSLDEDDGYSAPAPRKMVEVHRVGLGASINKSSFQIRRVDQTVCDKTYVRGVAHLRNECVLSFSIRSLGRCRLKVFSQCKLLPAQGSPSPFTRRYQDVDGYSVERVRRKGSPSTTNAKWISVDAEAAHQLVEVPCAPALVPAEHVLSHMQGPAVTSDNSCGNLVLVFETATPVPVRQYFTLLASLAPSNNADVANCLPRCHLLRHEIEVEKEGAVRTLSEAYGIAKVKTSSGGPGGAGDANSALDADARCAVCWSAPAAILTEPCGHVCMCDECAARCSLCPLCRTAVSSQQTIRVRTAGAGRPGL